MEVPDVSFSTASLLWNEGFGPSNSLSHKRGVSGSMVDPFGVLGLFLDTRVGSPHRPIDYREVSLSVRDEPAKWPSPVFKRTDETSHLCVVSPRLGDKGVRVLHSQPLTSTRRTLLSPIRDRHSCFPTRSLGNIRSPSPGPETQDRGETLSVHWDFYTIRDMESEE